MREYMNLIDVSSWQRGLDLSRVFAANPLDGAIVKATGGVSYVNPVCDGWVQWLIGNGKPWGFYHFLDDDGRDASGAKEAEFFVKNCANYFGDGMPFADYEGRATALGTGYLKEFLDTVYGMTGIRAGVYCNLSTLQGQDFGEIAEHHPLWLAQYAGNAPADFGTEPWQKGDIKPFERYVIHQYSANGRLKGYDGALDLDRVYLTGQEWDEMVAGVKTERPEGEKDRAVTLLEEALRILKGERE